MAKKKEVFVITERWKELTRDEQIEEIRSEMRRGSSYKKTARALGCTIGIVARICQDNDIKSTHAPGFQHVEKSSSGVALKIAASEATQCDAGVNGHRCAYERAPGSKYCALPEHQRLRKKKKSV